MLENATEKLIDILGCECEVIPPKEGAGEVLEIYEKAKAEGIREGYTPVLIVPDQNLLEMIKEAKAPSYYLEEYKKHKGKDILDGFLKEIKDYLEKEGESWEEVIGEVESGESMNEFIGFMPDDWNETLEVVLAKIPTKNPWEVFAWIPMGGWNECPPTEYMMAVMKDWSETYGAVPVVITQDIIECTILKRPETEEEAVAIGEEQYAFCPDIVEQCCGDATIGQLADTLLKSDIWFFWWD
ncbi:MAG: DUF4253 domain-containing protein [Lachnospiraceae bacterium]|nr:DUF4253 domain-containing protein [Lachnospiraceae bacterium]